MKKLGNKIVYELYPISFYDSNNDGLGDIRGIIEKLDYLSLLGVDIIWITPIFKSPKNDNGYDISNYYEIDPVFGTMEDVELLIKKAKEKNIDIMFDMVFNHISSESNWFKEYLKGNKEYKDYFYVIESEENDKKPNNWVSKFGGSAWEYNKNINGYYLHLFDKTQVDLNWNNPKVRKELINVVNFWINKGIKGFRFDVINLIGKPDQFNDSKDFGKSLYTDNPKVHLYLKELNKNSFGKYQDIITVGEMSSTTIENAIKYTNPKEEELDMIFNFHHLKVDYKNGNKWEDKEWDKNEFKQIIKTWQTKLDKFGWNAVFLNNHDQPRVNSRYGDVQNYWFASSTLFATLIFTLKGTPFIFQGEEIGMTNPNFDNINKYKDVESLNIYKELKLKNFSDKEIINILKNKSRDNSRTPFQWNDGLNAGFSSNKPWIEVASNYKEINAQKQIHDPNSIFNFYRSLIKLKKENEILISGSIEFIDSQDEIMIFKRILRNKEIIVCLNMSNKENNFSIDNKFSKILMNNYKVFNKDILLPFQAIVFENENE